MTTTAKPARTTRGQLPLPPPLTDRGAPRLLAAAAWRKAVRDYSGMGRDVKITAARLVDHAPHELARAVPLPSLADLARAAQLPVGTVRGAVAALIAAGWLAPARGPDGQGRTHARLCDPRGGAR